MALDNYAGLKDTVLAYIIRDGEADAMAKCVDWITLAEDTLRLKFNRIRSRYGETKDDAFAISASYTNLPTGFIRMRKVMLNYSSPSELDYISPQVADREYSLTSVNGKPRYYTVVGNQLRVMPTPESAYTATILYYSLPSLSESAPTNWLLTRHPKIYLTAVLAEAHCYYKDYEGEQAKAAQLDSMLEEMRVTDDSAEQGGNMRMRVASTP